jgi:hypothetical protein
MAPPGHPQNHLTPSSNLLRPGEEDTRNSPQRLVPRSSGDKDGFRQPENHKIIHAEQSPGELTLSQSFS